MNVKGLPDSLEKEVVNEWSGWGMSDRLVVSQAEEFKISSFD